ncbi:hypothetical protein PA25_38600 [Pseudoalteromonas sp. A25]|uniref:hypothetical protein n=1 Tax=Pseudoalteromonas sp. A25 TaxID=116092 RepID=UPI001260CAEA|nr:hypothetical protein [Pseudoalteromonas sp. A25]BBN83875.1 hypothetical protein PA25_38600 [Pseudoalteromonas sp. A25]
MRYVILLSYVFISLICFTVKAMDRVRYNIAQHMNDPKQAYYLSILQLALEKSADKYGDYQLISLSLDEAPQGRTLDLLANKDLLDVHWSVTSIEREQQLGTVYIPLLRGLMGARLFLIHKDNEQQFAAINNVQTLRQYSLGSGIDWPDTQIYERNDFDVATSDGSRLHSMLEQKRFDLFPRAVHEPWGEITDRADLLVERNFALCYPTAMYFFVNKNNHRLRKRLTYGLEKAIDDGSFEKRWLANPIIANALVNSELPKRQVLKINNPYMSIRTRDILKVARYLYEPIQACVTPLL